MNIAKAIQADVDAAGMGMPEPKLVDYLAAAKRAFADYANGDAVHQSPGEFAATVQLAHAYSAIAKAEAAREQAAQLKRLNDMLANYFEIMVDGAITNEREP